MTCRCFIYLIKSINYNKSSLGEIDMKDGNQVCFLLSYYD